MTARSGAYRSAAMAASLAAAIVLLAALVVFSETGHRYSDPGLSALRLGFKLAGRRLVECDESGMLKKEAEKYAKLVRETGRAPMKLPGAGDCSRRRNPVRVELTVDGRMTLKKEFRAGGLFEDGPSFVYGEFAVQPGPHSVDVRVSTSGAPEKSGRAEPAPYDYELHERVDFASGRVVAVRFDAAAGRLAIKP